MIRKLQMMIFLLEKFNKPIKVREWIEKHDIKKLGYQKKPIKKYDDEYRVRIREKKYFNIQTLKREFVEEGVLATFGEIEKK